MRTVLTTIPLKECHKEILKAISPQLHYIFCENERETTREQIEEANIIFGNVPPHLLSGAKRLELLQLNSAGTDGYTIDGVLPPGARLTNATGAYGLAISEHMLGMLLTMIKKLDRYCKNMECHVWRDEGNVTSIEDSVTLVVGMGDIGGAFAKKMAALGSRVIGIRRNAAGKPDYLDALYQMDMLDELLPKADFVACSLPGTKETFHLFSMERLKKMKSTSILLNVGRGSLIPTDDLTNALNTGIIGGACLDVTETEPLPEDSPLWEARNLILTPHISGYYHLRQTLDRIVEIGTHNIRAVCEGTPLRNEVDFETGYRKFSV